MQMIASLLIPLIKMQKQIKKFTVENYNKLAIIFTDEEIKEYGLRENDVIDLSDMFLIEGVKHE
jgi:hypothetical protein